MVNSVYEYLIQHFEANEPILKSDIILPISEVNLRQVLKRLCDAGNLKRYSPCVYYLPKESPLKFSVPFSPEDVAFKKYIKSNCNYIGYYSGFTFANQLGISTQVPYIMEITSNIASAKSRTIQIRGQKFLLRKSRIQITNDNWQLLQLLDLLKDINLYANPTKSASAIKKYIIDEKFTKKQLDTYLKDYPDKIYRIMYQLDLFDVFI